MPEHLANGSQRPPKIEGKLRLYSMEYCPYAQRSRLVLTAKKLPHDVVNVNLINKPDWYFDIHPEGKVPALDTGSEVIVESLVIADYLDEKYPENPLYPTDSAAKQADKELIKKIAPLTSKFFECVAKKQEKSPEEWVKEFSLLLDVFEQELSSRGTPFFGGDQPGMVDYMLWPWGERAALLTIVDGQRLPFGADQFPLLRKWRKSLFEHPVCRDSYNPPEKHLKVYQIKLKQLPPNYDDV